MGQIDPSRMVQAEIFSFWFRSPVVVAMNGIKNVDPRMMERRPSVKERVFVNYQ